jgi:putative DNA primase/helicase
MPEDTNKDATEPTEQPQPKQDPDAWKLKLIKKDRGKGYKGNHKNVQSFLLHHPEMKGRLAYDEFRQRVVWDMCAPWPAGPLVQRGQPWSDEDTTQVLIAMNCMLMDSTREIVNACVPVIAKRKTVHPVREYLQSSPHDGTKRLDNWLHTYLGAEDTEYTRKVGRKWMIQAVRRVMEPGSPAKYILTLEGPQDIGKSAALRILGGQWFLESKIDIGSKEGSMILQGSWIAELAEGEILSRSSAESLKQFIGNRFDKFVPKYSNVEVERLRQTVFAMTVNPGGDGAYLSDATGNVRFWTVPMTQCRFEALEADRNQLWAEAFAAWKAGESCDPAEEDRELFAVEVQERVQVDPWEAAIARGLVGVTETSISYVLREVLKVSDKAQERKDAARLGRELSKLGFKRSVRRESYDEHRCYVWRRGQEVAGSCAVQPLALGLAEASYVASLLREGWTERVLSDGRRVLTQEILDIHLCDMTGV